MVLGRSLHPNNGNGRRDSFVTGQAEATAAGMMLTFNFDDLFVQMLDYSRGDDDEAMPCSTDGLCYTILELASFTLEDYIGDRVRKQGRICTEQFLPKKLKVFI